LLALSGDRDADTAATLFLQSVALARKQGALAWELRAAMNLARLRAKQGRQRKAIELLEGVYNRFTEGFQTVDLLAARSLLGELVR
jgi:predicted ATPase